MVHEPLILLGASLLVAVAVSLAVCWLGTAWDAIARRRMADLLPEMQGLGLDEARLAFYLRWWGLGMLAGFLGFWLVLDLFILSLPVVGLIYLLPRFLLNRAIEHRRSQLREQMVGACSGLANACRAGLALAQGLEVVSKETSEPLATELRRIVNEFHRGRPLPEAIQDAQQRLRLDAVTLFASAVLTCLERGGRMTEALDRIAHSLREHQRLQGKLAADTASGRRVVLLLGLFPLLFLAGMYLLDPEGTGLMFATWIGQVILVAVGLMDYAGVLWARRIIQQAGGPG